MIINNLRGIKRNISEQIFDDQFELDYVLLNDTIKLKINSLPESLKLLRNDQIISIPDTGLEFSDHLSYYSIISDNDISGLFEFEIIVISEPPGTGDNYVSNPSKISLNILPVADLPIFNINKSA